jgi:2-succinyl-6-hydroxy-2,4-cyclohexadiene-1-carboxylate synthase
VDGLTSAGRLPVPVDLPGHGRHAGQDDPERFTLAAVFDELDQVTAPGPCPLVGYSMGGRLALAYAAQRPGRVTRLVLESASPGLRTDEERAARRGADDALAERIEREGIQAFVAQWEALPLFESQQALPPAVREAQRARRLLNAPNSLAAALRGLGTGALPSLWESLAALEIPVLLLSGGLDRKFTALAEEMALALPDARLATVDGAGHTVHLERPDAWLEAVLGFLLEG